ncbi:MAG: 50S ribosomal protein L29 [Rickettsiales bacterium]|nr:50S ribosomal protein L29 [Rickettsiales bacterium]
MTEKENLKNEVLKSKKKLLSLRIKKSSGDVKDTSVFKKTRKDIARLFTKMNNKQD